jgi:tRNA modification GTPase
MFCLDDTIAAVATPVGEGGIGIVRISGRDALKVAAAVFVPASGGKSVCLLKSHTITYGRVVDPHNGEAVDEALLSVMRAPLSYTRQDVAEINCHGGFLPVRRTLELALSAGARLAAPGEFTLRAFINGRLDLSQAEAVIDLIRAKTDAAGRMALSQLSGGVSQKINLLKDEAASICANVESHVDFPEEDIEPPALDAIIARLSALSESLVKLSATYESGRFFRDGVSCAIVGRPNVGKSSLLNALLEKDRAIVAAAAGTTRDTIEEYLNVEGLPVRIMDTAGIRLARKEAEREGVERSLRAIAEADVVVALFDGSTPLHSDDLKVIEKTAEKNTIHVINKSDLPRAFDEGELPGRINKEGVCAINISAKTFSGIRELKSAIVGAVLKGGGGDAEAVVVTNLRHKKAIDDAASALGRAGELMRGKTPLEVVAVELRTALDALGEITGAVTSEDLLGIIFTDFCIGK